MASGLEWVREKRAEVILHVIVITPLVWILEWFSHLFVQSGIVRDIGFYVIVVAVIAGSCFLLVWLDRKAVSKLTVAGSAATPVNTSFVGRWHLKSDVGHPDQAWELKLSSEAICTETGKTFVNKGTWRMVDGEVRVEWDTGWKDRLRAEDGIIRKFAFKPGVGWNGPISNTAIAIRQ